MAVVNKKKPGRLTASRPIRYDAVNETGGNVMELKNKVWMTGNLDWFAYIGDDAVFLGRREVPMPLDEGDRWVNELGFVFEVRNAEIVVVEKGDPPERAW